MAMPGEPASLRGGTHGEAASAASPSTALLGIRGVTKVFPGTVALDRVTMDFAAGEIHALLGANGAGKSTLIKVLAGMYPPDGGSIVYRGQEARPWVTRLPITFIHQDLGLVPSMTVAENIALGAGFPRQRGLIRWRQVTAQAERALDAVGSPIDPRSEVARLTSAERALVAIARALAVRSEVIVLDEPTAALPESEVVHLFQSLRRLRADGVAVIYVTHRLDEVFRLADRATVLRDGTVSGTSRVSDTDPQELVERIVGRRVVAPELPSAPTAGEPLLVVRDLRVGPLGPVDLAVAPGEILGLVGLTGAGHHAVGRAISGVLPITSGSMGLGGEPYAPQAPVDAIVEGVAFVSSDRAGESVATTLTVLENLYPRPRDGARLTAPLRPFSRRAELRRTHDAIARLGVRPDDPDRVAATLSGGNQQKVVVGRTLEGSTRLFVLEEPTAGVDVGARADIYRLLAGAAGAGAGVLMVSSDFEEVVRTCHRALVMDRGRIVADVPRAQLSVEALTHLASGEPWSGASGADLTSSGEGTRA